MPGVWGAGSEPRQKDERKPFFFEKKNQKTFVLIALRLRVPRAPIRKSFCFFFQKVGLSCCGRVSLNGSWY
jgi:hypothetical protein